MFTVREVASRLAVSEQCVYRLVERALLKAHRIGLGRGTIRISEEQLADYLSAVETEGKQPFHQHRRPNLKHLQL